MAFSLIYIILAVLGLGFLVFIHELGHYIVARRQGMKVEAFAIGFGKPIFTWVHDGVEWRICMLPFGGYVKIAGMEKEGDVEPADMPDGFFGKSPWQRIKVAFAGPLVNIVFAFAVFVVLWLSGGREKAFSEFTNHIGWVDPKSELYEKGVRPGDSITTYDHKPYNGFRDLLMVGLIKSEQTQIAGFKLDPVTGAEQPYDYTLKTYQSNERFRTIGVLAPASYLIVGGEAKTQSLKESGIELGDRIIWADGELIASNVQLSEIVNDTSALLMIQRGEELIQIKVPRFQIDEFTLAASESGEMDDWQHEAAIGGRLQDHFFIPYLVAPDLKVESRIRFFDETKNFNYTLQEGDRILSVDGIAVATTKDLFETIQQRHVRLVVQRDPAMMAKTLWTNADTEFEQFNFADLHALATFSKESAGNLHMLKPVVPVAYSTLAPDQKLQKDIYVLGVGMKDRQVQYNPTPIAQFYDVLQQTWTTLSSLFTGQASAKNVAGPIGIISIVQQSWAYGYKEALYWMALISLNLGIMNLLPLPVLDGGHIVISFGEMITRRRMKSKTMERLIIPFVGLMILFFIFVTYQDIARLFSKIF
jgi:regulator of sigma E protease